MTSRNTTKSTTSAKRTVKPNYNINGSTDKNEMHIARQILFKFLCNSTGPISSLCSSRLQVIMKKNPLTTAPTKLLKTASFMPVYIAIARAGKHDIAAYKRKLLKIFVEFIVYVSNMQSNLFSTPSAASRPALPFASSIPVALGKARVFRDPWAKDGLSWSCNPIGPCQTQR